MLDDESVLKKVKQVIDSVLGREERVLEDPAPTVAVSELAASSVNFVVRPWVKAVDYGGAYFDVTQEIEEALDEKGISIAYPQRDVPVINAEASWVALVVAGRSN